MTDFKQLIDDVSEQFRRVIIINEKESNQYKKYCKDHSIPIINLSAKLAELTADLDEEEKEMETWDKLKDWMETIDDKIVAFDNIDYIFSNEIGKIDPVKEFNYFSRSHLIIILFIHARKKNNILIYSEQGNPDYKEMDISLNEGFVIGW